MAAPWRLPGGSLPALLYIRTLKHPNTQTPLHQILRLIVCIIDNLCKGHTTFEAKNFPSQVPWPGVFINSSQETIASSPLKDAEHSH